MKELTGRISLQFSNGKRVISMEPNENQAMMVEAAVMYQNQFKCFKVKSSTDECFVALVPSSRCDNANANEIFYWSLVKRKWTSFDEFIMYGFQMFYMLRLSKHSYRQESTCTCDPFFKENICKHILAVATLQR